jgi:hypothetical protein
VAIVGTNFPTPKPSLTDFQASITAAQDAIVEADGKVNDARAAVAARRTAVDALLANVRLLAAYVESESGGDTDKILSSGFDVRAASNGHNPQAPSATISIVSLVPTNNEGELRLRIKPFKHALYYEIFTTATPDNAASWVLRKTDSRSSTLLPGLASGVKTYVRVRAKLRDGFTGFSAETGRMVP